MSKDQLEEKVRALAEESGLSATDIADVFGTMHSEFQMLADDEALE